MSVSVIIPFDTDCPHRHAAFQWVKARLNARYPDWQVCVGKSPGQWCRPRALINAALEADGDYFVIQEPDSWSLDIDTAVNRVLYGDAYWSVGHTFKHRLTEIATYDVLTNEIHSKFLLKQLDTIERPYFLVSGNTGIVMHRDTFFACPPDTRFKGWGAEDEAWGMALTCLVGAPWRSVTEPLIHLWHPGEGRRSNGKWQTSNESSALFSQYSCAMADWKRGAFTPMKQLVSEAKQLMAVNV